MLNNNSRKKNSIINFLVLTISQIIILILSFISRTIFIDKLGDKFLGINSFLLTMMNIISIFSFGINTTLLYLLYKPIYSNDENKISRIYTYLKKIYKLIALIILIVGVICIPISYLLIDYDIDKSSFIIYYILYLSNSIITYFIIFDTIIFTADQKQYVINIYTLIFTILKDIIQIIVLLTSKSYIVYIVVLILTNFLQYFLCSLRARKKYPSITKREEITEEEKKEINKSLFSMGIIQGSSIILMYTTSIVITLYNGIITLGHYTNYTMIIDNINTFVIGCFTALTASIGNLNASNDEQKKYNMYKTTTFFAVIIYGFCSICFILLIDDFIELWLGKEYILNKSTLFIIIASFFIQGLFRPTILYRESTSLFIKTKYIIIITAILNIILSIILGKIWGINGILISPILTRLFTNYWFEIKQLNKYFGKSIGKYLLYILKNILLVIIIGVIMYFILSYKANTIMQFVGKILYIILLFSGLTTIIFIKNKELAFIIKSIVSIFKERLSKKNEI